MMSEYITIALSLLLVIVWAKPLASYMAAVYAQIPHPMARLLGGFERFIYRLCGINPKEHMSWRGYALSVILLGLFGFILLFVIFIAQGHLPLNPQSFPGLSFHAAFNASISFITNTNWQSYSGETSLSYFSQTVGITIQHFISAATGMAVAVALCRSFAPNSDGVGNFWVDLVSTILYILLPISFIFGLVLVSQGVVQNYGAYIHFQSLEGAESALAQGPAALQTAIKMLGSNGGGFFGVNSAHPYENPNAISNLLQLSSILLIPVAFVYTAGMIMRDRRQGVMMLAVMFVLFIPLASLAVWQEMTPSNKWDSALIDTSAGNLEGKETRFGIVSSAYWGASATATANGSANASYDSFSPMSGFVQLLFMQVGEVIFGGVGSGLYGMVVYVLMATFIAGLMVGRTPEFMGKKLLPFDIKMISIILLLPAILSMLGVAIAVSTDVGRNAITNPGPHAFMQILYAFNSAANNNGSAFAGLQAANSFFDIALGICMVSTRYGIIVAVLALAGSFSRKITTPVSAGTLPTHSPIFAVVILLVIVILGSLNYIPSLVLGPIAEHLLLTVTP